MLLFISSVQLKIFQIKSPFNFINRKLNCELLNVCYS